MFGGFPPTSKEDMRRQLYEGLVEFGFYAIVLRALPYIFHGGKSLLGKFFNRAIEN